MAQNEVRPSVGSGGDILLSGEQIPLVVAYLYAERTEMGPVRSLRTCRSLAM